MEHPTSPPLLSLKLIGITSLLGLLVLAALGYFLFRPTAPAPAVLQLEKERAGTLAGVVDTLPARARRLARPTSPTISF